MNSPIPSEPFRRSASSMMCALIKLAALLVISASAHGQAILHVDDDASPGGDGLSWSSAFDSLQTGLEAAAIIATPENPVELRIAQGRYVPTKRTDEADPRTATFQLLNNVSLLGGFAGIGAAEPDLRDLDVFETILSGDINGDDGPEFVNYGENTRVLAGSDIDGSVVLDGLSVSAGLTWGFDSSGGGAGLRLVNASPRVQNCKFKFNKAGYGGGVAAIGGQPEFAECYFEGNRATSAGGAMWVAEDSQVTLDRSQFVANSSQSSGGALFYDHDNDVQISRSTFTENSSEVGGAVRTFPVLSSNRNVFIQSCAFEGNRASVGGAAIQVSSNIGGVFRNCTFHANDGFAGSALIILMEHPVPGALWEIDACRFEKNFAEYHGGALTGYGRMAINNCLFNQNVALSGAGTYVTAGTDVTFTNCNWIGHDGRAVASISPIPPKFRNCILRGNVPGHVYSQTPGAAISTWEATHSNIEGGWLGVGSNNLDADPMFVQAGCGNLRLAHDSPCIDAGDNSAIPSGITADLDGNPRILNGIVDMGAYEGGHDMLPPTACESDLDAGEFVRLIPSGGPFNPQVNAAVNVTNVTEETNDAWATVEATEVHTHPGAAGYRDLAEILTMQTSLANGEMFTRVMIPFDADDIGILNPLNVDVTFFDASANRWHLAVESNTVNSPKHDGPVGDRIVVEGTAGPFGFTAQVGDHGVFWNEFKQRGFAWANVDHATEFGIGTLLSSCQADCAAPSGVVGPADLMVVLGAWGDAVAGEPGDVNADRMVNIDDVLYVVAHWGACQ